jgi:hypothetical protein
MNNRKIKQAAGKTTALPKRQTAKERPEAVKPKAAPDQNIDIPQETVELYLRPDSFAALAFPMQPEEHSDDHSPLTDSENRLLTECEDQIEKGFKSSAEMAAAFFTIKTKRLYREIHRTFEEYCRKRWKFSRQHGYRIAKTGEIQGLAAQYGYMVNNENEGRRLGRLSTEELRKVLEIAASKSNGQPITKRLLSEIQAEVEGERKPTVKKSAKTATPSGGALPDLSTLVSLAQILVWLDEILLDPSIDQKSHDRLEMIKSALALHVNVSVSNIKAA